MLKKLGTKDMAFWLVYIGAIVLFVFRPEQYERPLAYFIVMAFTIGILAIQILQAEKEKKQIVYILCKVGLLILTIQWTQLLVYPDSVIGTDPWYHRALTEKVIHGAGVNRIDYYGTLSFHLLVGNFQLLTGLSEKWAMMIVVGMPYIAVVTLVVYKLGSLVWTYKIGLMSALSLSVAGLFLFFSIEIIPSTYGIMLVMLMLYFMIGILRNRNSRYNVIRYFVVVILLLVIMFTNSLVVLISMVLLGLFWVSLLIYDKVINRRCGLEGNFLKAPMNYHSLIIIACVYLIVVLAWWTFGTGQTGVILRMIGSEELAKLIAPYMPYGNLLLEKGLLDGTNYFSGELPDASFWANAFTHISPSITSPPLSPSRYPEVIQMINQYQNSIPITENIVKRATLLIYGFFGLYGIYAMARQWQTMRVFGFAIMVTAVVITTTCLLNAVLSRYLFLSRHILIAQIMLAPMVGYGILRLSDKVRNLEWKQIIVGASVFILAFSTFISPYANIDNRDLLPNSSVRLSLTQEELKGIDDVCSMWKGKVYTDWYVGYYVHHVKPIKKQWQFKDVYDVSEAMVFSDYSNLPQDAVVLVRNELNEYPIIVGDRYYRLDNNVDETLIRQGFRVGYSNGVVRGYVR